MVDLPEPPTGWGTDNITGFIDNTRLNCFATYANLRQEYAKLAEVDAVFRKLVENPHQHPRLVRSVLPSSRSFGVSSWCTPGDGGPGGRDLRLAAVVSENGLYGLYWTEPGFTGNLVAAP